MILHVIKVVEANRVERKCDWAKYLKNLTNIKQRSLDNKTLKGKKSVLKPALRSGKFPGVLALYIARRACNREALFRVPLWGTFIKEYP